MATRASTPTSTTRTRAPSTRRREKRFPDVPEGTAPEPAGTSLRALREAAAACKRCDLWRPATQTVFGEGSPKARIFVIGEQPGDREDMAGEPFVGPAGRIFDQAIEDLGLDRKSMYVTNAVKHFKFEPRGKRRIHKQPNPAEQKACHVWLERELKAVKAEVVVCLGAIAAKAVFGSKFALMKQHGEWQELPDGRRAFATMHPSWVLRQRGDADREAAFRTFRADLALLTELERRH
ncbi:UdgX family uracil-DNA binding protein [Cognatilysobacter terrigena]|uniref:UdgX family uracil-DNA binding protein n=1 Tax=Cognatilysobacter terrigena TaxID=2488749 RepID=UPI00105E8725|nr:UdgX family uracil-DNA binding protein [Lysobacter terrigena]